MNNKQYIQSLLRKHILSINFLKKDGSPRTMTCTLREDLIKPHVKTTDRVKKPNDEVVSVWDTENDAFRSFRISSLIDYAVMREGYEL